MASGVTALAAVGFAGLFEGAAAYNLLAHPVPYYHRKYERDAREEDTTELLHEWRRMFPRAAAMQAPLVSLGALTSGATAYLQSGNGAVGEGTSPIAMAFGVAAACQVATFAYTMWKLMPLNHTLLPKGGVEGSNSEKEIRGMLVHWGRMHAVRVALGGVALGGCLYGLKLMLE